MPDQKKDHETVLTRIGSDSYKDMILAEIDFVKALGSKNGLILASSNLSPAQWRGLFSPPSAVFERHRDAHDRDSGQNSTKEAGQVCPQR